MAGVTLNNLTINGISVAFSGGAITSVTVQYTGAGPAGETLSGNFTWQLTAAEQSSAAATGFVAALTAKLATVTGLTVATT